MNTPNFKIDYQTLYPQMQEDDHPAFVELDNMEMVLSISIALQKIHELSFKKLIHTTHFQLGVEEISTKYPHLCQTFCPEKGKQQTLRLRQVDRLQTQYDLERRQWPDIFGCQSFYYQLSF